MSKELEAFLESRGKKDLADEVRKISNLINVSYVRQGEPLGLGHAVLVTETIVGNEPFAVILADDVIDATPPALKQMIDVFEKAGGPVLAVERVPMDQVSSYGVIAGEPAPELGKGVYRVTDLVEKPPREEAPSDLAIIGRYILTPDIFASLHANSEGQVGRDPADERPPAPAEVAADLRAGDRRRAPRHRQQAGVPEGERLLRVEAARARRAVPGIPEDPEVDGFDSRLRVSLLVSVFVSVFGSRLVSDLLSGSPLTTSRTPAWCTVALARVVGDVEAAALELNRRRRQQLHHRRRRTSGRPSIGASEYFWITSKRCAHASH